VSGYSKNDRGNWVPCASADLWASRRDGIDDDGPLVAARVEVAEDGTYETVQCLVYPESMRYSGHRFNPDTILGLVREIDKLNAKNAKEADTRRRMTWRERAYGVS
jgi:hypothetical protein